MKKIFLFVFILFFIQIAYSQTDSVKLVQFSKGYIFPLGIENCGDTRLFIVQKGGQIKVCDSSGKLFSTPFLDISGRVNSSADESGLLGLAFDPHYLINGVFYVYYINQAGNAQISQFKVNSNNPNLADSNSEKKVLDIPLPSLSHVGGCLRFGPDGYLYLGIGDGNNSSLVGDPNNNSQNPSLLSGKLLRIKVKYNGTYSVPRSNPFRHVPNYRKEIWALGLRNPWRFSFDAFSGNLYIADAGEAKREEVDVQAASSNVVKTMAGAVMKAILLTTLPTVQVKMLILFRYMYMDITAARLQIALSWAGSCIEERNIPVCMENISLPISAVASYDP